MSGVRTNLQLLNARHYELDKSQEKREEEVEEKDKSKSVANFSDFGW